MELVFLDESGSPLASYGAFQSGYEAKLARARAGTGPHPAYPLFVLAAVGLPESKFPVVDGWLDEVKRGYLNAPSGAVGRAYEIKGAILYSLLLGRPPLEWRQGHGRPRPYSLAQARVRG